MGEHSTDHHAVKTKDNMETLENSLTHLIDQMMYIARQQEYQRVPVLKNNHSLKPGLTLSSEPCFECIHVGVVSDLFGKRCPSLHVTVFSILPLVQEKEEVFRQISENTNGKVLWWAVVQTSILLSVGFWQMKRLKDFFVAKKLV